jgi:hypothetical protein
MTSREYCICFLHSIIFIDLSLYREAEIVCGRDGFARDTSEYGSTSEDITNDISNNALIWKAHQPSSIWTKHIPGWMNFSYSTVRQRVRHPIRRQPNPFGPQISSFSRLESISLHRYTTSDEPDHNAEVGGPARFDVDDQRAEHILKEPRPVMNSNPWTRDDVLEPSKLVVRHPAPAAWDDEPHMDLPYDNPYYTRPIDNVLWLPRDPFGILDLDDTVDLRVSLTSNIHCGQLGTWLGQEVGSSPKPLAADANPLQTSGQTEIPRRQYSGSEEIELPLAIAKRVQALEEEEDVEDFTPRRPSVFGSRKLSSGDGNGLRGARKPSMGDGFRSYSSSSGGRKRSASVFSALEAPQTAADQPSGTRPDIHAQADFVRSNLSVMHASTSQLSVAIPRSQSITTHDAVVTEVIAQETSALVDRLEDEWAESRSNPRSWLTAWMFAKRE